MELDVIKEEDPCRDVLQYARWRGLCKDYLTEQPPLRDIEPPTEEAIEADLDLDGLAHLSLTNYEDYNSKLTKERLAVSKEAALLLRAVHELQQQPDPLQDPSLQLHRRSKLLKLEVPILRTDHELDVQAFGNISIPDFSKQKIPLENVDNEKDEGLEFPSSYDQYPVKVNRGLESEKISIPKEGLVFLSNAIRDTWTREDSERVISESGQYQRNKATEPLTPPLLPSSPLYQPYVPSSPGTRLELLSECTNSTAAELKSLEDRVMQDDSLIPPMNLDDPAGVSLLEGLDAELDEEVSPHFGDVDLQTDKRRKRQDLRIEGPLTPPMFSESPMKKIKSVSFPEMLHEYIPMPPSTFEDGNDVLSSSDSFNGFFEPYAEKAEKMVRNERLSEADTTKRVDVPDLDFTQPIAPWSEFSRKAKGKHPSGETELDAQTKFLVRVKREELKNTSSWHGLTKLERELHWSPFPTSIATVKIEEKLHGEEVLSKMLGDLTVGDIVNSSTCLWKRDGLRILEDEDDYEDDLEHADYGIEVTTVEQAIRKRKVEIDEENEDAGKTKRPMPPKPQTSTQHGALTNRPRPQPDQHSRNVPQSQPATNVLKEPDNSLMFGGTFSASTALHKFMQMHGETLSIPEPRTHPSQNLQPPATSGVHHPSKNTAGGTVQIRNPPTPEIQVPQTPEQVQPLDLPPLPEVLPPSSFIISSRLLQQRTVAREIEKAYTDAELIERDFALPHSAAQEADLILSPSTGLMLTTIQQIKQKPLPGQREPTPVQQRIINLQKRYERLIILISEGLSKQSEEIGGSRPLDPRDEEALAVFNRCTSALEADVTNEFVRGGEKALARALVIQMARWGLPHGSKDIGDIRLLQDETHWELFLRRTGLNPYAAQTILASLKSPYDLPVASSSPAASDVSARALSIFGLPAFMLMSTEERIERFQALLGGSRILGRASALIDQHWVSAAHGFAM